LEEAEAVVEVEEAEVEAVTSTTTTIITTKVGASTTTTTTVATKGGAQVEAPDEDHPSKAIIPIPV
jgi:hypothetical protein